MSGSCWAESFKILPTDSNTRVFSSLVLCVSLGRPVVGPAPTESKKYLRDNKKPMEETKDDNEEHDLKESSEHVSGFYEEQHYRDDRRRGALHDGIADQSERVAHAFQLICAFRGDERVGDVRRIVDAEPDAHDDVDHRDAVQVDVPPGHEANDAGADGRDAEGDRDAASQRRNEQHRYDEHGGRRQSEVPDRGRHHDGVLVVEYEERMEDCHMVGVARILGYLARSLHHRRLANCRGDVLGCHVKSRRDHWGVFTVPLDVERVLAIRETREKCGVRSGEVVPVPNGSFAVNSLEPSCPCKRRHCVVEEIRVILERLKNLSDIHTGWVNFDP